MKFAEALDIVKHVVDGLEDIEYDGIIVKRLEASNTLDDGRTTNQTHIAISGEQMNIFPYLMADGYFQCDYDEKDEQLKKYFITQIPLRISKQNVDYLLDGQLNEGFIYNTNGYMNVRTSIVRSRRKAQADQVQMSLTTFDDKGFVAFRKILHTGDFLVLLKVKEKLEYDFIGVKGKDETKGQYHLSDLNNKFFKLPTNTKVDISNMIKIKELGEDFTNKLIETKNARITGASNILLYGVPGAGKSHAIKMEYCADKTYMERVVFHPDYTYSDFVGQILPRVIEGTLKYVFTPGPFTKMLKKAESDPIHMYYLVIEEVNRGNAPAIFGEIFQLLDRKEESEYPVEEVGESEYGISNYDVALEVYGDAEHEVKIPSNMSILATMNTADQNVFTLDTAFQRRWDMHQIRNNVLVAGHAQEKIVGTNISWGAFATVINDMVIDINSDIASSEDKRLGAYFVKRKELAADKFSEKVLKYLWDDAFKMEKNSVFKSEYNSLEEVIIAYESATGDKLSTVLRQDVYNKMLSNMKALDENITINTTID